MSKVICMGESLIDFMPLGKEVAFVAKAGGAPSNVCACVAKLGGDGYYLGKMSKDMFSRFLLTNMQKYGVNTDYVNFDGKYPTALAFVTLDDKGDREFSFYRTSTCDTMFDKANVNIDMFDEGDILHYCSLGLIDAPTKDAHGYAIECARTKGALVSFDVNVRLGLWESVDKCVDAINEYLPYADIVKVTDDELVLITGIKDEQKAVAEMFNRASNSRVLILTKGSKGATVYDRNMKSVSHKAVDVKVVDTTGAGDCFIGCILYLLSQHTIKLSLEDMAQAIDFASYGCGIVIGNYGAMEAMPTIGDIKELRNKLNAKRRKE